VAAAPDRDDVASSRLRRGRRGRGGAAGAAGACFGGNSDELGLLVWEEAPGWHNVSTMAAWQDAVVRGVRDMVIRDRSRPSVIIWGTRLDDYGTEDKTGTVALKPPLPGLPYGSLLGPGPYDIKWAGVADGFRVPKPGAAIYQAQGDPAVRPVIVPLFFWEAAGAVPAPGAITLTASHPRLGQAEVQVRSAVMKNTSELG
jgi:hypothetical protein